MTVEYSRQLRHSALNFTGNSEISVRGGGRAGVYSELFDFQKVIGRKFASCSHSLLKNHTRHTMSPPRDNAQAETFIISPEPRRASQSPAASAGTGKDWQLHREGAIGCGGRTHPGYTRHGTGSH